MLFDLRGRGRRRTVQAIYLTLALLMGGGLVLFGIGSDAGQGGLVDAFTGGGGGSGNDQVDDLVERAEERARANPRDPAAFAALAQARYQAANTGDRVDPNTGRPTAEGRTALQGAVQAWQRHVQLAGDRPDADVAVVMTNAYEALGQFGQAASTWSLSVTGGDEQAGAGQFVRLAQLYYQAGDTRQGDLAADRAVETAPRGQRRALRRQLEQAKTQLLQQQAQGAAGGAATTP
jgi:tetratricopeptide (TPR) repeat protein